MKAKKSVKKAIKKVAKKAVKVVKNAGTLGGSKGC